MFSRRKRQDALPPPPLADADPEAVEVFDAEWARPTDDPKDITDQHGRIP